MGQENNFREQIIYFEPHNNGFHLLLAKSLFLKIFLQLKDADTNYMPFHQALVLEGEKDEGEELKKELQELHNVMKQRFMNMNVHFDARLDAIEVIVQIELIMVLIMYYCRNF